MLYSLSNTAWTGPFSSDEQESAIRALEAGKVIFLPNLSFALNADELKLLTPRALEGRSKNISFDPHTQKIKGHEKSTEETLSLMMQRFFHQSRFLINSLLPHYQKNVLVGRTSFRPIKVVNRKTSLLKDDTRLHVDAFSATPNHGKRILRVFSNINPQGEVRHWHLGEPLEAVVEQFKQYLKAPIPGVSSLLSWLNITKTPRSLYDHYMLQLHNEMKKNEAYQQTVEKTAVDFPAGATWVVMTDSVSHAALYGQHLLEQTFYLPVFGMQNPEKSPLKILERMLNKKLIKEIMQ